MPPSDPPAPRRSTRIKRKVERLVAAPPPQSSPPPPKKPKLATNHQPHANPSPSVDYKPSPETVFLAQGYKTFSWIPPTSRRKGAIDMAKTIANFDDDVHSYFTSKKAGDHAADNRTSAAMYRHVGAVTVAKFLPDETFRTAWKKSTQKEIHISDEVLATCEGADKKLLNALYSMAKPFQEPYEAPYIVLLANAKKCASINSKNGSDLQVEVYIGRLLFELIAYEDIKVLFTALRPSVPFAPLPQVPQYPQTLAKSPAPPNDDRYSLSGLLRRAESTGYATLTEEQRHKVKEHLKVDLYPFQEQTVRWMIDKEVDSYPINDYFWEERYFTTSSRKKTCKFYYFPMAGELRLRKPPPTRGGMVTEEMGLGKTIEALALIAAQRKTHAVQELDIYCEDKPQGVSISGGKVNVNRLRQQNQDSHNFVPSLLNFGDEVLDHNPDEEFPKTIKVRRWPAKSTLVLCPSSLLGQWKREAKQRAPSLSVEVWKPTQGRKFRGTDSSVAVGEDARDIVLATYETLSRDPLLSKITWKRLILDEAQLTRRSSAQVARDTFNLRSYSRFLMTGTPIVKDLDDLRGELAFLRIWPFTLFEDGFWESRIFLPFVMRRSTTLIDHLLSVTMIRHTKAQQLSIELPQRTYQTIEVELSASHRAVYCFILTCCLEELDLWGTSISLSVPRQIRALLRILVSSCICPSLVNLTNLDLIRRNIWARRRFFNGPRQQGAFNNVKLEEVSPTDAIRFLAETGTRIVRDSNRSHASLNHASSNNPETYANMDIDDLRAVVESRGLLPVGRTIKRDRLVQLAVGGVHRLSGDTLEELHNTIVQLRLLPMATAALLTREHATALLMSHYASTEAKGTSDSIHEAGFAALMKLIERDESPSCPVCLMPSVDRIALTKCGHFYCMDCITLMFESGGGRTVRCAICRRQITSSGGAVEVKRKEQSSFKSKKEIECLEEKEEAPETEPYALSIISEADVRRYASSPQPTTEEAWTEYREIGLAPRRYRNIGLNPDLPSLDADFLRHMAATQAPNAVAPKLYALRELIRSTEPGTKFCVVAETTDSLKGICTWLEKQGIRSVGVGAPGWRGTTRSVGDAVEMFCTDPSIQIFLLNTANSAGLTLTVAQYVVFMETMVRITDEMQAAARVHRIGQTRPVKIIRIVAKNTIEEQIMFRRGEILSAAQETNALISPSGSETPAGEIIRLFRDPSVRGQYP